MYTFRTNMECIPRWVTRSTCTCTLGTRGKWFRLTCSRRRQCRWKVDEEGNPVHAFGGSSLTMKQWLSAICSCGGRKIWEHAVEGKQFDCNQFQTYLVSVCWDPMHIIPNFIHDVDEPPPGLVRSPPSSSSGIIRPLGESPSRFPRSKFRWIGIPGTDRDTAWR